MLVYKFTVTLCSLAVLATTAAFAQTKPAFEVATIKPAPPMDMAKVEGNYDTSIDLSLLELLAMARTARADIPVGVPGGAGGGGNVPVASDPGGGGTSLTDAVQSMGLKLESRKAMVDQLIVDHIEKSPTEN
jgi:uncharacterized protein (TIGR03435 family)